MVLFFDYSVLSSLTAPRRNASLDPKVNSDKEKYGIMCVCVCVCVCKVPPILEVNYLFCLMNVDVQTQSV